MSETIDCRLPASVREWLASHSAATGVSQGQFIAAAVGEKMAAVESRGYLEQRAARGTRSAFDAVLAQVPDVPPSPGDERPALESGQ